MYDKDYESQSHLSRSILQRDRVQGAIEIRSSYDYFAFSPQFFKTVQGNAFQSLLEGKNTRRPMYTNIKATNSSINISRKESPLS